MQRQATSALLAAVLFIPALLGAQSAPSRSAQVRLWDAAIAGDTTALKEALADGARIDSLDTREAQNGRRALNWAALYDRVDALKLLLADGASLDAPNLTWNTPLHHAAESGALGTLRALLAAGADPMAINLDGNSPLEVALRHHHADAAELLQGAMRKERL